MPCSFRTPLTRRQREVFDFIRFFIRDKGFSPSLAEIGEQFRLSSLATSHKHVETLREKGYIRTTWNRTRSIEVIRGNDGLCPFCGQAMPAEARL